MKRRYFKELKMSQLRSLTALEKGIGFAGAAASLDITAPSVWQQVRALEDDLKVKLVQVDGHQVRLTQAGQLCVLLAKPLVLSFDQFREQFFELMSGKLHHIRIAAPNNVLVNDLPGPISEYRKAYPHVSMSLVDLPSSPSRNLLESGDVDLAVVGQLGLNFPASLVADRVADFPFMLVCTANNPLLNKRRIQVKDLITYPIIMPSLGTNARTRADETFLTSGVREKVRIAIETNTKELLLRYVQMDFGIAIAPISPRYLADSSTQSIADNLKFRDLSNLFGVEHLVLLRRQDRHEPEHQRVFRETVLRLLNQAS